MGYFFRGYVGTLFFLGLFFGGHVGTFFCFGVFFFKLVNQEINGPISRPADFGAFYERVGRSMGAVSFRAQNGVSFDIVK